MGTIETKIVVAVAAELIKSLFDKDRDSCLTDKIIVARSREEIRNAIRDELTDILAETAVLNPEIGKMIDDLVTANNGDAIKEIVESPKVQKNIIEAIVGIFKGIAGLIFGEGE